MMENNYICLLTLIGFTYELSWVQTGRTRHLLIGAAALGLNLLTRLTTALDLLVGVLWVVSLLWHSGLRGRELRGRLVKYVQTVTPIFLSFAVIERLYQYHRFGSFTTTYFGVAAAEAKLLNPSLPAAFPFEKPFLPGFLGALFSPEKSVFLFDPLILLLILILVTSWKSIDMTIKAYIVAGCILLLAYISFYAKYTVWSGDFAWGDRYVSTGVQLVAFVTVPLLLQHRKHLGRLYWLGISIIATSLVIQIASLAFWLPLEIYQMESFGHPTFVIALRMKNIVAFATHNMAAWGLITPAMSQDPWDYMHITCWNFLPFLLRGVGAAPLWTIRLTLGLWAISIAGMALTLWKLMRLMKTRQLCSGTLSS